jgi:hypothetical protein
MHLTPALVRPLEEYLAAAVAGTALPVTEVRLALDGIADETIREKALGQFHLIHVLGAVMQPDRSSYVLAVHHGCMELLNFLREAQPGEAAA